MKNRKDFSTFVQIIAIACVFKKNDNRKIVQHHSDNKIICLNKKFFKNQDMC